MVICAIIGCKNRPGSKRNVPINQKITFCKTPAIIYNQCEKTRQLSEERRRLWKAAVYRKDIVTEEKWNSIVVCSRHFIGGTKAYLHMRNSPNWLPTLHLGHSKSLENPLALKTKDRYERLVSRKKRQAAICDEVPRKKISKHADGGENGTGSFLPVSPKKENEIIFIKEEVADT